MVSPENPDGVSLNLNHNRIRSREFGLCAGGVRQPCREWRA